MRTLSSFRRMLAMAHKEVLHMARDVRVIYFSLGMPVVMIFLFGYAVSFDIENIPLAVVDMDNTSASRGISEAMTSSGTFRLVARPSTPEAVEPLFRVGAVKVALVIPKGTYREMKKGKNASIQLMVDGADNTTASVAVGYASSVMVQHSRKTAAAGAGGVASVDILMEAPVRVLFNPALKSARYMVPGLIVVVLSMMTVILTALTVAREWERGSMEQLFSTPVGTVEIVIGKLIPYFVMGLLQVLLVVTLGMWMFDVPLRGSFLLLMGVSAIFLCSMLAQGVLISVLAKNQMVATQASAVTTILPALLLSGFVFPLENMPWILQAIADLFPPKYFMICIRSIMLRGNGLSVLGPELIPMSMFLLVVLLVSTFAFKRRLA